MIHYDFKYCYSDVSGGFEEEVAFKIFLVNLLFGE